MLLQGFLLLQLSRRSDQVAAGAFMLTSDTDCRLGRAPWQFYSAAVLCWPTSPVHLASPIRRWKLFPGDWCPGWVRHRPRSWIHSQCGMDRCDDGWCWVPGCIPVDFIFDFFSCLISYWVVWWDKGWPTDIGCTSCYYFYAFFVKQYKRVVL